MLLLWTFQCIFSVNIPVPTVQQTNHPRFRRNEDAQASGSNGENNLVETEDLELFDSDKEN